tara:strand:- start:274 stop:1314 length:1041 start_codon:yes stop_codon:yes gene_type:complete
MPKKIIDFVHVGDYKTGTSWLQKTIFPFHPEIQYLGDYFKKNELKEVLTELIDIRDLDFDFKKLRKKFNENFTTNNNQICGISREALSQSNYIEGENAERNAKRIKKVFGEVKIIYVIREQISMLSSIYSQYLKMGGTRNFNDWFLDPIECRGIIERLKYNKNIKMYQDIFGKENVLVLLFEELVEDKRKFLEKLYRFIGCQNINFEPEESEQVINSSLTTHGALILRTLQKLFRNSYHNYRSAFLNIDKVIYFFLSKKIIDKFDKDTEKMIVPSYETIDKKQRVLFSINMAMSEKLTKLCEKIKTGKKIQVPVDQISNILPLFKESNNLLNQKYDLNIDKYHWHI